MLLAVLTSELAIDYLKLAGEIAALSGLAIAYDKRQRELEAEREAKFSKLWREYRQLAKETDSRLDKAEKAIAILSDRARR